MYSLIGISASNKRIPILSYLVPRFAEVFTDLNYDGARYDYGNATSGAAAGNAWALAVGIEITGKLEDFMARNSLLVNRFYNEIAAGYECCKRRARIHDRRPHPSLLFSIFPTLPVKAAEKSTQMDPVPDVSSSSNPSSWRMIRKTEFTEASSSFDN